MYLKYGLMCCTIHWDSPEEKDAITRAVDLLKTKFANRHILSPNPDNPPYLEGPPIPELEQIQPARVVAYADL